MWGGGKGIHYQRPVSGPVLVKLAAWLLACAAGTCAGGATSPRRPESSAAAPCMRTGRSRRTSPTTTASPLKLVSSKLTCTKLGANNGDKGDEE